MLKSLDREDWDKVFGDGVVPDAPPSDPTPWDTFSREDVALIKGQIDGERLEEDWIVWGQLKDGRWFFVAGGCDYTCWSHYGSVASTEADIIGFGMTDTERKRFGLSLSADSET